jgi:CRISPR/Cas system-associated endoribonuclease Cas2
MNIDEKLLIRAKAYENSTHPKPIIVEAFGTESQKKQFEKLGRFKDKEKEQPFIKTLKQLFESVEAVKVKGIRAKQYKLGAARHEVAERKDNRSNNGGTELDYTKYLDVIVLMGIKSKMFNHEATLNQWVLNFGLVNETFYDLKVHNNLTNRRKLQKEFARDGVINHENSDFELNFYRDQYERISEELKRTLERMQKAKLIEFYKVPKVRLKKPLVKYVNGKKLEAHVITIDTGTQERISKKQEELKEKHELTDFDTYRGNFNRVKKEKRADVAKYHEELDEFFTGDEMYYKNEFKEEVPIEVDYFWFNHAITSRATDRKVITYLEKKRPEFLEEHKESIELVFESQKNFFLDSKREDVFKQAIKRKERELIRINKKYKEELEGGERFGTKNMKQAANEKFWEFDFCNNVDKAYPTFKADFSQGIRKYSSSL